MYDAKSTAIFALAKWGPKLQELDPFPANVTHNTPAFTLVGPVITGHRLYHCSHRAGCEPATIPGTKRVKSITRLLGYPDHYDPMIRSDRTPLSTLKEWHA